MTALLPTLGGAFGDPADLLRIDGTALSAQRLLGAATAVADRISGAPVVAISATASAGTIVGVVGALLAGVPVVPMPPDSGPAERRHLLADSGVTLVLDPENTFPPTDGVTVIPIDLDAVSATSYPEPPDDAVALILYTSGTTGAPKGVRLTRAAIAADLDAVADAWSWTPDDVLAHGLPLFHVHGLVLGVLGPLRIGSRLVHTRRPTPEGYAAAGASLYFGVPTVWSRVCADESAARALAGARLLVSGSAGLPVPVFQRLAELTGRPPVERYGMTETLITVSSRADGERRAGQVGLPLRGVRTRLVGEDGAVLDDPEAVGELQVSGPTLFRDYLNRQDATAASHTEDGWFRTGDVARIGADGWHRIVGRASTDLIKSGGYRIGAGEVEDVLLGHPGVREAAVIGTPHPDLGQQVTAFVVAEGVSGAELTEFVARELSVHKRPRQVHLVDALPRNAMGKVQKKLLPES
ncbi:MAG TPA: acyl-CoA synthetase [Pseudonocardiaceae bacterium]